MLGPLLGVIRHFVTACNMAVNLHLAKYNKYAAKVKLTSVPGRTFQYPGFMAPFSYYHVYVPRQVTGKNMQINAAELKDQKGAGVEDKKDVAAPFSQEDIKSVITHPVKVSEGQFQELLKKSNVEQTNIKRKKDAPEAVAKKMKPDTAFKFE
jgi:hypothetical protein